MITSQQHSPIASTEAQLGLGLIPDDGRVSLRTVSRARASNSAVFVLDTGLEGDAVSSLEELGATVLEPPADAESRRSKLVSAAEADGCDGLVVTGSGDRVDLDASRRRSIASSSFSTEAVTTPSSADPGRLIGIPAYNEGASIEAIVEQAAEFAAEVVVVDDGSSDDTVEVVNETDATLLEHEHNQGKGTALRTLFEYVRTTDYDSLVILDGDGQHLPEEIPTVVEPVEAADADMVIGSRYLETDEDETPGYRRVGQQVLDYLTFGSSGTKLSDTQSGFRAFSRNAVETLSIETTGMGVESELIMDAQDAELEITERPIDVRYEDVDGQTLNPVHHGLSVALFLARSMPERRPGLFYGTLGAALLSVVAVVGWLTRSVSSSE
ncbi:glycosyltransferase family 2 protein [Natronococcus sp. A-GB1]|uniref:glycosyltransferase family 2 protein n=1 Tax=Natronococcus sp. A-GB1 TaxID=3037648 RepID=UPI00241EB973|nr:glycosyltransferase family 2 protein [Natronococcus sp. A-GB1]MDG5760352.1 glycosyltransferase family 2 protein [Natronococcus sp. A-GB1]